MTLADNLALPWTRWTPIRGATARIPFRRSSSSWGWAVRRPSTARSRAEEARRHCAGHDARAESAVLRRAAGYYPISAVELDELIVTLSRDLGITIVIVTHELPSIFMVANSCIVLDKTAKGIGTWRPAHAARHLRDPVRAQLLHAVLA